MTWLSEIEEKLDDGVSRSSEDEKRMADVIRELADIVIDVDVFMIATKKEAWDDCRLRIMDGLAHLSSDARELFEDA